MRGTSTMCEPDTRSGSASDLYIYDPESLSAAQCMGDACAVCHVQWPRPRTILGVLPDGGRVLGCGECAELMGLTPRSRASGALTAAR